MDLKRTRNLDPIETLPSAPAMTVTSADFSDGGPLPESAGFATGNRSPQLSWEGAPAGTQSFLLVCHDPDAPVLGGFRHWALARIPADVTSIEAGGEVEGALGLPNDYGTRDFGGAAPPEGDEAHRYVFTVWALGNDGSHIEGDTSVAKAQFSSLEHVLARGSITGTFSQ